MRNNLYQAINYINDTFRFNSKIPEESILKLIKKYHISKNQEKFIYKELSELNIEIVKKSEHEKIISIVEELFDNVIDNSIDEELFNTTLNNYNVINKDKEDIIYSLTANKIKIVKKDEIDYDIKSEFLKEFSDICEYQNFLEDEDFKKDFDEFEIIADKNDNWEYLTNYQIGKDVERNRSLLVEANMNLVSKIALKYAILSTTSFGLEDMIQAGLMGLLSAIEKFDLNKGCKFSTYATYWIRQAITRAIADYSTTIRIPVHKREEINKLNRIESNLYNSLNRMPTIKELSEELEISIERVTEDIYYRSLLNLINYETPVSEDGETELIDLYLDKNQISVEKIVINKNISERINQILSTLLSEKEKNIIMLRFGFDGNKGKTLEEVGEMYNLTRERIRQIEKRSLEKIKKNRQKELKEILNEY